MNPRELPPEPGLSGPLPTKPAAAPPTKPDSNVYDRPVPGQPGRWMNHKGQISTEHQPAKGAATWQT